MNTVYGILCSGDGMAWTTQLQQGDDRPELRTRAWTTPPAEVRRHQPESILIDRNHDGRWVGEIVHLELRHDAIWAVGHVRDDVLPFVLVEVAGKPVRVEQDLYFSVSRYGGPDFGGLVIDSVALTPNPARVAAQPVTIQPGELNSRKSWATPSEQRGLLERAYETNLRRRSRDPIVVQRPDGPRVERTARPGAWIVDDQLVTTPPAGALRIRPCTITSVR